MPESKSSRLSVLKTYKLYIGGKFPRTESGRYLVAEAPRTRKHLANYCQASRKDLRDAVTAARKATSGWASTTSYLRSQILYRAAEMLEGRNTSLQSELVTSSSLTTAKATSEIAASVDRLIYYAGWADKYQQVFGSVNPVASSHFNFTTPEPTGVVAVICPDSPPLLPLVSLMAANILSGNSVIILASEKAPLTAISFAEILATSDLPGGVVNILTGHRAELAPHIASHMDINAVVDASSDPAIREQIRAGAGENLKRVCTLDLNPAQWSGPEGADPYRILDTVEFKTAWHPIGV